MSDRSIHPPIGFSADGRRCRARSALRRHGSSSRRSTRRLDESPRPRIREGALQAALGGGTRLPRRPAQRRRLHLHRHAGLRGADAAAHRERRPERRLVQGGGRGGAARASTTTRRNTASFRAADWRAGRSTRSSCGRLRRSSEERTSAEGTRRAIAGAPSAWIPALFRRAPDRHGGAPAPTKRCAQSARDRRVSGEPDGGAGSQQPAGGRHVPLAGPGAGGPHRQPAREALHRAEPGISLHGVAGGHRLAWPSGWRNSVQQVETAEAALQRYREQNDAISLEGPREHRRAEARRAEHRGDAREDGAASERGRRPAVARDRARPGRAGYVPGRSSATPSSSARRRSLRGLQQQQAQSSDRLGQLHPGHAQAAVGDPERAAQAAGRDRQRRAVGAHRLPGGARAGAEPRRGAGAAEERGALR